MSLISVIIPVYNEENNLPFLLRQLKNMFVHTTHDFEAIQKMS